jgi:hypothetical protein
LAPEALAAALADGIGGALLVPELAAAVPADQAQRLLQREDGRLALFDSVAAALLGAAGRAVAGLLVILDHLHWADEASLQLLLQLARRRGGLRDPEWPDPPRPRPGPQPGSVGLYVVPPTAGAKPIAKDAWCPTAAVAWCRAWQRRRTPVA